MALTRPDAEAAWVAWLHAGGYGGASTRIPPEHTDGMLRVSRVGGRRINIVIDEVQMLVEAWHSDPYTASELAHDAAERIEAARDGAILAAGVQAKNVTTTGPLEFPDPSSALTRYQFTFTSTLRRVK